MKGIQYKRGMTLPDKTIYVGRPSVYGNPFKVNLQFCKKCGQQMAVAQFILWLDGTFDKVRPELIDRKIKLLGEIPSLKGNDLACWCEVGTPCHRDVLLKMAND